MLKDKFASNSAIQFTPQDVVDGSLAPLLAGSKQSVTLSMPQESTNTTYFIALRAIDKTNLRADPSNIVSVQLSLVNKGQHLIPTIRGANLIVYFILTLIASVSLSNY